MDSPTLPSLQIPVFVHDTCSTSLPLDFDGWQLAVREFEVVAVQIFLLRVTALMKTLSWLGTDAWAESGPAALESMRTSGTECRVR